NAPSPSALTSSGNKGNNSPPTAAFPPGANPHVAHGDPGRDESAGTVDRQVFFGSGPRPSTALEELLGPPPLGIVFPLHHFPGTPDHAPPPGVPSASSIPISPTVLSSEVAEEPNSALPTLSIPGAGSRSGDSFWVEFLPALPERSEEITSAV